MMESGNLTSSTQFRGRMSRRHELGASPPLEGGPNCRAEGDSKFGEGNDAGKCPRPRGSPSPKIAGASRQRFVAPPSRVLKGRANPSLWLGFPERPRVSHICKSGY